MSNVKNVKDLEELLVKWDDQIGYEPLICHKFRKALFNLVTFVSITSASYSAYSGNSNTQLSQLNEKLKQEKSNVSADSILSDIMSAYIVPELYSFSLVGGWGLLEEFLRDATFLSIINNLESGKPAKNTKVKEKSIDLKKLVAQLLEPSKRNINELEKLYKNTFGIDLKTNEDYKALHRLRQKRHKIAHTGKLLGYDSIIEELFPLDDFTKQLYDIGRRSGEEFTDVKTTYDEKKHPVLHITRHQFDPTETITSKELEENFCSTIVHMWKLCDFLTEELFLKTKEP